MSAPTPNEPELAAPETEPAGDADQATGLERWSSRLVSAIFLAAVGFPLLLTLVGLRPQLLENRPPAQLPTLSATSLQRAETYSDLGDYLSDRLAIRSIAIRVNSKIDETLFGARSDDVIRGSDGWLYYRNSLTELCRDPLEAATVVDSLDLLATALRDGGASLEIVVAPAKPWLYPENLPSDAARDVECGDQARAEVREALEGRDWYVDLYPRLEELARASVEPIYHPRDTHWTQRTSLLMVEALVDNGAGNQSGNQSGKLFDANDVVDTGSRELLPDLVRLLGLDNPVAEETVAIKRDGVLAIEAPSTPVEGQRPARRFTATADDSNLIEGRTVFVYDSFVEVPDVFELLVPYYADITFVHWDTLTATGGAEWLANADHVVIEVAEREIANRTREAIIEPGLIEQLMP